MDPTGPAAELADELATLRPWSTQAAMGDADWAGYLRVARLVQRLGPDVVEAGIETYLRRSRDWEFTGTEPDSVPFLLMRVVFDLPEDAPVADRRPFKGWINWPAADDRGRVNMAWPLSWRTGAPALVADYAGSEGGPYRGPLEYRYLLENYPFRRLDEGSAR